MEAKNKQGRVRVPRVPEQYITQDGESIRVLPYNFPRTSGRRTGGDKNFLKNNNLRKFYNTI